MYGKFFAQTFTGSMMGRGAPVFAVWAYVIANVSAKGRVELNPRLLAAVIGATPEEVRQAVEYLCAPDPESRTKDHDGRRMLKVGEYDYQVPNAVKYRSIRNEEERREYNRNKMRESRAAAAAGATATPTAPSAPPASEPPAAPPEKSAKPVAKFVLPDWVPAEAWAAWIEVRQRKKAPNTHRALAIALGSLEKLRAAGQDPKAVLEQATTRGYTGLFEVKSNGGAQPPAGLPELWWRSDDGVLAKAKEIGLTRDLRESAFAFKVRVLDEAGEGPWIDERDTTTYRHIMERRARKGAAGAAA